MSHPSRSPAGPRERWIAARVRRRLRAARYWYSIGELDEAVRAGRQALALARSRPAGVGSALLLADIALTVARAEQDRDHADAAQDQLTFARSLLESTIGTGTRIGDDSRLDEGARLLAWTLIGLGENHRRAGRYPQAVETLDQAIELAQAHPGPRLLLTAALTGRAITAKELGEYDQAARGYARVQQIHDDAGATPASMATLAHNLSGLEYAQGRYAQAESHARRALDLRRRGPGSKVDVAADLAVLAAAIAAQHRPDEAREMFEQALSICRAAHPPRRYEIAVQLHGLAAVEHAAGRLDHAERRYREALALKEDLLGPGHPEVGNLSRLLDEGPFQHADQ